MNFLFVKYFCDAVRLGGVSAAAKANFVTQSAVSQAITKLEQSLHCSLLARHPNRFRLTPAGQKAFEQLSEILKKAHDFQSNFSPTEMGPLEFACTHSFALAILPPYLKRFRTEYPDIKINFHCLSNPHEIKHHLKMGSIDFGILSNAGEGFEKKVIYKGSYGLYTCSPATSFILPEPEDTSTFKNAYAQKYGKEPDVFLEVGSWEVVANLVAEGLGIGYFPDYIAAKRNLHPCEPDLLLPTYEISAIYPTGMKLRKSSELFLSFFS